ncbi:hypothetical protein [Paenibacillus sp. UMB4589-SE434]|nr:hypothetical protein [Paenibacillus sp. UMB4589-SE434]MDK8183513.1 hypothetical protein [Paenibacillus sp. UMB4589-SE434]
MLQQSKVKTFKYRVGKNKYLVIKIYQSATAKAVHGNALASNAINLKIFKAIQKRRKKR